MNALRMTSWCTLIALLAAGTAIGLSQRSPAQQMPASSQNGVEVLTRGPVHEAFAETITFDPEPGIVIAKAPPDPIEEVAPNQRPEGSNVSWIPGYWGWDDERNDFLWVSGIWRALPPGRQWVPGYWGQSQQGFQWTSGYWADATASDIDYLPEPPATVEAGPNVAAPSADATWLPGSWIWQQNRYGWRAGYWTQGNPDWDWTPDHYVWTPRGYVYVDGYYDYSVPRRGVVFAPVYFNQGLRSQRGYSYTPSTVINPGVFVNHLFLRPNYGHYYFGDYYGSNYATAGYSPWFAYQSSHRGYDPIYASQRWQHRRDHGWEQNTEANYRNLRDHENSRPPRNWDAQSALGVQREASNVRNFAVAESLDQLTQRKDGQLRFQSVAPAERQQLSQRGKAYRSYLQQRQQMEAVSAPAPKADPAAGTAPARRQFSRSPFVALRADQLGKDYSPPQRHQVLKPDFNIQPQARTHGGPLGTLSGFGSGTMVGPAGPMQVGPQGQQRQGMNRGGYRAGAAAGQLPGQSGQGSNQGGRLQGREQGGQQVAPDGQQPSGTSGASGQPTGVAGAQEQSPPQTPPASQSE